jgi:hypothetical protein
MRVLASQLINVDTRFQDEHAAFLGDKVSDSPIC